MEEGVQPQKSSFSLNRNQLKYIAICGMLLDHIAYLFQKFFYNYTWGFALVFVFRTLGRITAPVMSWFLVQGFIHTSSKKRYALRLFIFAIISQFPYALIHRSSGAMAQVNVIYTLLLSFLMLCLLESRLEAVPKWTLIFVLMAFSIFGDWAFFLPVMVLCFYFLRDNKKYLLIFYSILSLLVLVSDITILCLKGYHWYLELWQAGMFLFIPLYLSYYGQAGSRAGFHKWFFYVFYPLHLLILWGLFTAFVK